MQMSISFHARARVTLLTGESEYLTASEGDSLNGAVRDRCDDGAHDDYGDICVVGRGAGGSVESYAVEQMV